MKRSDSSGYRSGARSQPWRTPEKVSGFGVSHALGRSVSSESSWLPMFAEGNSFVRMKDTGWRSYGNIFVLGCFYRRSNFAAVGTVIIICDHVSGVVCVRVGVSLGVLQAGRMKRNQSVFWRENIIAIWWAVCRSWLFSFPEILRDSLFRLKLGFICRVRRSVTVLHTQHLQIGLLVKAVCPKSFPAS